MLSAARLVNLPRCETEDGFPGPLGGFSITGAFLGSFATSAAHAAQPRRWVRRLPART